MVRHRGTLTFILAGMVALTGCGKSAQAPAPQAPAAAQPASPPAPAPQAPAPATPSQAAAPSWPVAVSFTDISGINAEQAIKDMAALGIFESTTGEFKPRDPITRAEFVRWLVTADNIYYKDAPKEQIRLAESDEATFVDVPATRPDFKYIQGMANAGYVIGVDKTHFAPDRPITREEMIAIKIGRDTRGTTGPGDPSGLPYTDKMKVNRIYAAAVDRASSVFSTQDIGRIWGSIKTFNPQKVVTRAEAAVCLSAFGWTGQTPFVNAAKAAGRTP